MAIIVGIPTCAICEQKIYEKDFFATSGVFFPEDDPLFHFCDAPIHWDCYEKWPHRARFASQYVDVVVESTTHNPYWFQVDLTPTYFLQVNPGEYVSAVDLYIFETGGGVRVNLSEWDSWIVNPTAAIEGRHRLEREALGKVLPELYRKFPTAESILKAIGT